ncbi:MAG: energy-coupling factor transporter transmembrane protein EcfT [Peptostreptococcaceae bacterium]|jgi:energy-coupling factor transport system permease protein|nr:energy-coupling factor transporter transmembrane protein EcfT [Peptostreptococcaceae bacterium]
MEDIKDYVFKPQRPRGFYLDPRTKLIFMACLSISLVVFGKDILMLVLLATIPFCLLLINKQFKIALIYGGLFAFGVFAAYAHNTWTLGSVLNAIVILSVALVVKIFPTFMFGYYIIDSTSVRDFVAAMKKWKVSDKFIIPVSVLFRFLPTIKEESEAIKKAMKMRGLQFGSFYSLRHPMLYIEYRVIPLLISIAKIGEELSAAALTRGLGVDVKRTSIAVIGFSTYDYILGLISLSLIIYGVLRGVSF